MSTKKLHSDKLAKEENEEDKIAIGINFDPADRFAHHITEISGKGGVELINTDDDRKFIELNLALKAVEAVIEEAMVATIDATAQTFKDEMERKQEKIFEKLGLREGIIH